METEKLSEWYRISEDLKILKSRERELRIEVFNCYFPNPEEGSSTRNLGGGYKLRCQYKLNRNIDLDLLAVLSEKLDETVRKGLTNTKVSLNLNTYRRLSSSDRQIVDNALIIKPGAPSIEIIPPKK